MNYANYTYKAILHTEIASMKFDKTSPSSTDKQKKLDIIALDKIKLQNDQLIFVKNSKQHKIKY